MKMNEEAKKWAEEQMMFTLSDYCYEYDGEEYDWGIDQLAWTFFSSVLKQLPKNEINRLLMKLWEIELDSKYKNDQFKVESRKVIKEEIKKLWYEWANE